MKPNKLSSILFLTCLPGAILTFHLAYLFPPLAGLVGVTLFCLLMLSRVLSNRMAFYTGIATGMAIYGPQLFFFFGIFSYFAVFLWFILAFWIGLFLLLMRTVYETHGKYRAALLAPFLWMGIEYFRSELYPLRFTWLNAGFAFADAPWRIGMHYLGVYGVGFALMALAAAVSVLGWKKAAPVGVALLAALLIISNVGPGTETGGNGKDGPFVVGVQLELPHTELVIIELDNALLKYPDADLFVLSEYTFNKPVPEPVREWCKEKKKYLILGAEEPTGENRNDFYNTAFVIGPEGKTVFKQVKCMPVQFFDDGLPAKKQALWESPWGKIGLCICYDLSYSFVTDTLVRLGAQAIIVPTGDPAIWGFHQHKLHARVAPTRAAEYGIPVFRVVSSGISQHVNSDGQVMATAPYPGQGEIMAGRLRLKEKGSVPFDRYLALLSVLITALTIIWLFIVIIRNRRMLAVPLAAR